MTATATPSEGRKSRWRHVPLGELFATYGNTAGGDDEVLKTGHEPIHDSKSGACVVAWPESGRWWCSSCRVSGDAASYLMAAESIDYPEAAKRLTEQYGAPPDDLPQIIGRARQLRHVTADALAALVASNDPPRLFVQEDALVRLVPTKDSALVVQAVSDAHIRNELTAAADFVYIKIDRKTGEELRIPFPPPTEVVADVLAQPGWPFPHLRGVVDRPTLRRDGSLLDTHGYDEASGLYLSRAPGLQVPPIAEQPAPEDVARAKALLSVVIQDFPFVDDSDRATAFALGLLPFVRELVDGPTPLHMLEAPTPGVGKGLLADVLTHPSCGRAGRTMVTQARDDDEYRKRLLAVLREQRQAIQFDNINRVLDSGALCSVLTAWPAWSDRLLGVNVTLTVPVRCTWLATANNVAASMEVARRTVRCRLDPQVERPWMRSGFRIERLFEWVADRRGDLIWAYLTLARSWIAAGRPAWKGRALGSFERWSDVVGGILQHTGIPGFLDGLESFYESADTETGVWRAFVSAWWETFHDQEVGARDLFPIAKDTDGLDLGNSTSERAQQIRFGKMLGRQRDRVIAGYRLAATRLDHKLQMWRLLPTTSPQSPNPPPMGDEGYVGDVGVCSPTPIPASVPVGDDFPRGMGAKTYPDIHNIPPEEPGECLICRRPSPRSLTPCLECLSTEPVTEPSGGAVAGGYTLITNQAELAEALPVLLAATAVGLDTETAVAAGTDPADRKNKTALDPRQGRVRLVQLATADQTFVIDHFLVSDLSPLAPLFTKGGPVLVGHNIKFDLEFLAATGLPIPSTLVFDTMLAAHLLEDAATTHPKGHFGLGQVVARYLGTPIDKAEQTSDWSGPLSQEQLEYAARDATVLLPLKRKLGGLLREAELERAALIESRAIPAFVWMGVAGAPFDLGAWEGLGNQAAQQRDAIEAELYELAGHPVNPFAKGKKIGEPLNWGSSKQVKEFFVQRGHQIDSTSADNLKTLADQDPAAKLLLDLREAGKRATTYGESFSKYVQRIDGRIHPNWTQIGSRAGRTSCSHPNLQNVPKSRDYRACFRPRDGRVLVKADYSQIELRIAAHISRDRRMLQAYQQAEDLHSVTAAAVLGRSNGSVTPEARQAAKALNFGLLYGMGWGTFKEHARTHYGVELTDDEAMSHRNAFRRTYSGLTAWQRRQGGDFGSGPIDTRTLAGRRRLAVENYTEKLNSPVQGTGADGLKLAMALLWETRDRVPSAELVLEVHDEIVLEVDEHDADQAREWLTECMVQGMAELVKDVPIVVEPQIMRDWSGSSK